jgi:hypothetical protein
MLMSYQEQRISHIDVEKKFKALSNEKQVFLCVGWRTKLQFALDQLMFLVQKKLLTRKC